MNLKERIRNKKAKIAIIGMGYVGLPLAVAFASRGYKVIGIEQDISRTKMINVGKNYIADIKGEEFLRLVKKGLVKATNDYTVLRRSDAVIICVPTPLDKNRQPDMSYVMFATDKIVENMKKGQLIVLESTTYPGTTEEIIMRKIEQLGLKVGKDFYLAFSPERIDPGNKKYSVRDVPKIIGGITSRCTNLAKLLYLQIISNIFVVSSPRTAEMTKLFENIFRSVNIALVNELAILCKKMNIDIWEVIDAAKTKPYGFMPFLPGPGIGGHCIPLDPFYLAWKAKEYNMNARFIELAGEINNYMPEYVIQLIQESLNKVRKSLNGVKILILGMAYKKDIGDYRESPSLKIIQELQNKGAIVKYNDPYITTIKINDRIMKSQILNSTNLRKADCVVIVTDHSVYDYEDIIKNASMLVDTRNATKSLNHYSAEIIKI